MVLNSSSSDPDFLEFFLGLHVPKTSLTFSSDPDGASIDLQPGSGNLGDVLANRMRVCGFKVIRPRPHHQTGEAR